MCSSSKVTYTGWIKLGGFEGVFFVVIVCDQAW